MRTPVFRTKLTDVGGWFVVVAFLALASPGVTAEPEGPPAADIPSAGFAGLTNDPAGSCEPTTPIQRAQSRADLAARMREAALRQATENGEAIVALNGRGYNYKRARDPLAALAVIQAEARRQ